MLGASDYTDPMGRHEDEGGVAAAIHELATADVVAFDGVGIVGRILPVTVAYRKVASALAHESAEVRPQLVRLLASGSPAGKAYAATLLDRLDPEAARAAWDSLADDRSELATFSGCIMVQTTLAEYARGPGRHR